MSGVALTGGERELGEVGERSPGDHPLLLLVDRCEHLLDDARSLPSGEEAAADLGRLERPTAWGTGAGHRVGAGS